MMKAHKTFFSALLLLILLTCSCEETATRSEAEQQELAFISAKQKIIPLMAKDQNLEAEMIFDSLVYSNTKSYAYYYLGGILKSNCGKADLALDFLQKALAIYETEEAHMAVAQIYRQTKDSVNFINTINRLIQLNPNEARYYGEFADYFASQGIYIMAIETITKAINLCPTDQKSSYYLARARYRTKFNDQPAAMADFDSALIYDNSNCMVHLEKVTCYLNAKKLRQAIQSANEALKLNCEQGSILYRRGLAKFLANDVLGAKDDILKAIELNNEEAIHYLTDLAPYGFKVLFPRKYREALVNNEAMMPVIVTTDSCTRRALAPTSFSLSVPASFRINYRGSNNSYCTFRKENRAGVIVHEIKLVEGAMGDEKKNTLEIQRLIEQQIPSFRFISCQTELFNNMPYYVLRGKVNFDKFHSKEYKGDYFLTFFVVQPINKTRLGFSWNELISTSVGIQASNMQTSLMLRNLHFY